MFQNALNLECTNVRAFLICVLIWEIFGGAQSCWTFFWWCPGTWAPPSATALKPNSKPRAQQILPGFEPETPSMLSERSTTPLRWLENRMPIPNPNHILCCNIFHAVFYANPRQKPWIRATILTSLFETFVNHSLHWNAGC